MPPPLSKEEKLRIRGVLYEDAPYETLQTTEEFHQVALRWNWDYGFEALQWIIRQPHCDQGTALLIYWLAAPRWFCQWSDSPQTMANNRGVGTFDLIDEIEKRYAAGFYTQHNIGIDPQHAAGLGDLTRPHASATEVRGLPHLMFQPTPGEPFVREDTLYDSIIRRLTSAEQQQIDDQLAGGLKIMRQHTGWITLEANPLAVVKTIKAVVLEDCERHPKNSTVKDDEPLLSLGWVWAEQLCRAYHWQWLTRDTEGKVNIGVFSPEQIYESHPPGVIQSHLRRCKYDDAIVDLYRQLGHIAKPGQLAGAYMRGWVWHNRRPPAIADM